MQLYFAPLACSLATRIALYEAGADATFVEVDTKTKKLVEDGADYLAIHPLGVVPALRIDDPTGSEQPSDGQLLTENAAVLQWIADRYPDAQLGARTPLERARLQQWLSFIGTELHKAVFQPLLDAKAPEAVRSYVLAKVDVRFDWLARALEGREFLLDRFSVADAYLYTALNWAQVTPIDLSKWPAIQAYVRRLRKRPSIVRAFDDEKMLYVRELERRAAAA